MVQESTFLNQVKHNILFQGLEESLLECVLSNVREVNVRSGDIIFEDGSVGDEIHLVISGGLYVCKSITSGDTAIISKINEGEIIGELEMIDGLSRFARVVAYKDSKLAVIPMKVLRELLESSHDFALKLLQVLSYRVRSTNQSFLSVVEQNIEIAERQLEKLSILIEASKNVNSSLELDKLLEIILETAVKSVNADRGTLFLVDEAKNELWSKLLKGEKKVEIRLPVGKGIAGWVAATGIVVNIIDAYAEPRFNPEIDRMTGYNTKSILCVPMKNRVGKIIGVFQLLNKLNGEFTKEDENLIEALSVHASIAFENAQLAKQMVESERLSAVGKMASSIIHDIKNPMGTIRLYAELIRKNIGNEKIGKMVDDMMHQIDRFVNMTQEILDFARGVSSMNIQNVELGDVLGNIFTFIDKDLINRNIKLIKNFQYTGKAYIDADKLIRAFYNIVKNSVDAMPNGGSIIVNSFKKHNDAIIEFIDSGIGMTPEVKDRIFEPFFTSGKKHGTGLGMAIVKKIVDDHKGKLEIESELNKGTTVRVQLPLGQF